uniref:uncharacterized protein LOC122585979 n=1 Tax=Erigeron canadensis TaxID=72917 RepID=UPI001CB95D48|nr:uncharacterized protein LOC122585979 [Erigeron canadensis]
MTQLLVSNFLLYYFLLFSPLFITTMAFEDFPPLNETSMTGNKLKTMKLINAHLKKINRPFLKSIKTSDGDIIDCVLFNLQLSFDLHEIKEKMSWKDPPEMPKGHDNTKMETEIKQLWSSKGESCPNGTIPIRRTTASDVLRSMSISKSGKNVGEMKYPGAQNHKHAIAETQGEFHGAKATLNLWKPNVVGDDFSLSQIWVISNTNVDQTLEAGWHVFPSLNNKDNNPRLFNYWTADGYDRSGCYNLRCPGFVQTNNRIALGAALGPISMYNGAQYDISFLIWKDPRSGDWWLKVGSEVIGYWPQTLFTDLRDHATLLEYGGEVYSPNLGTHTLTPMGSGHFPTEGFGKAAYARNLEMVGLDDMLHPVSSFSLIAEKPDCYTAIKGYTKDWGGYIFFGGPGNNPNCP